MSRLKSVNIEYANFLCHFGDGVFLDKYATIFYPAITSGRKRVHGDSTYSLNNVRHLEINTEEDQTDFFLYGKIVKDFTYTREQLLDKDGNLKADKASLRDSPTSTFILSLKDHRLYYIKEFQLAPSMAQFKLLIEKLISDFIDNLIHEEYEAKKRRRLESGGQIKATTKTALKTSHPKPTIKLIKQSSPEGIDEFVNSIKKIEKIELTFNRTNHESDFNPLFESVRDTGQKLGNGTTKKLVYKSSKGSLEHQGVAALAKASTKDNNSGFVIQGKGMDGESVKGSEEDFAVKVPLKELHDVPEVLARKAYTSYWDKVRDGFIKEPVIRNAEKVRQKIADIMEFLK